LVPDKEPLILQQDDPHKCELTNYHEEDSPAYNKDPRILQSYCSNCAEELKISYSAPAFICKKKWHGWDFDGEGGRGGRSGTCDRPYLCSKCYRRLTVEMDEDADGEGEEGGRRMKRRRGGNN
jgi:hypothetical protein